MKRLTMGALLLSAVISTSTLKAQQANKLSAKERKAGWQLLFDGKTTKGWHTYHQTTASPAWHATDGTLELNQAAKKDGAPGGDLVTDGEYENYELSIDWKISPGGNSGIIFSVNESPEFKETYLTGPEMQVLDDDKHRDGKIIKHNAGDLYDLKKSAQKAVKPVGEWNTATITKKDGHLTLRLNGVTTVETTMGTPEWDALVNDSKFKTWTGFGKYAKGHIALQDHGDQVWYRNIKIRQL
ncbi:3-keto-disaccharide hydrolase [Chitinophaga nivalis]|uniref:DUF1080 domain-containing protein n=1 Tax=Chitinophaga nivalis TaxID=2991709 RepID=A0ABT3ITP8_9BACT|nr:DUF1080 domain-containing protein [Chitinophaga nivalis]MCW3462941.1 DUF1080 domain-containing protein [Chitinophaga nivalis]MCW3487369.1 DUF1080 domain-containing protein [Chitinophaga nivalis]